MTEFSFADDQDFGTMLDAQLAKVKTEFEIGERLSGVVTAIDSSNIFVDISAKSEGIIDRHEFVDANGELTIKVGDTIEAFCVRNGDDIRLTTKISGNLIDASLLEAYESKIPIEGRVDSERKGGFAVVVANQTAFCPYSQIDLYRQDAAAYLGQKFSFLISEYDDGRNLVVSRRRLLEQEQQRQKQQLQAELSEGQVRQGRVTKLMPFGVFVDIGGVDGLVPLRELGWGRDIKPEDIVKPGDEVSVEILKIDWEQERFTLSLRGAQPSPWHTVEQKYTIGQRLVGTVTKLMTFGAFVELEPGLDGLVHISKLGTGRRINHPDEVVKVGDTLEVRVDSIDCEQQRISLSMSTDAVEEESAAAAAIGETTAVIDVGNEVVGVVDGIKPFGVFVRLSDGRSGLLHISQTDEREAANPVRALEKQFPPQSQLKVVIKEINGDRISLTLRSTIEKETADKVDVTAYQTKPELGSIGDLFAGLDL